MNVLKMMKLSRHAVQMAMMRNTCKNSFENLKERDNSRNLRLAGRIILKRILKE